jgi:WD40 repeat protein
VADPVTLIPLLRPPTQGCTIQLASIAARSRCGRPLLASASGDGSVQLWDPDTGAPVGRPLTGHSEGVTSVAFGTGADGQLLLASASEDRTVRLWDPRDRRPIVTLRRRSAARSVSFTREAVAIG